MTNTIHLTEFENWIENLGKWTCTPTASVPPRFRVRGETLDPHRSIQSQVAAKPATTLVLPMSPETAIQLAVAILRAAEQANIPLPKEVIFQSAQA